MMCPKSTELLKHSVGSAAGPPPVPAPAPAPPASAEGGEPGAPGGLYCVTQERVTSTLLYSRTCGGQGSVGTGGEKKETKNLRKVGSE